MRVGIVGHEALKFTPKGEVRARTIIRALLTPPGTILVSGGCHLGGIDIWAEEVADSLGRSKEIHLPQNLQWSSGYKERNIKIAKTSDILHCIAVISLPKEFKGMRHSTCYHCNATDHVKGGSCWTMKVAKNFGKPTVLHRVDNETG